MLTLDASSVKAMNDYLFVFCHISLSAGSYHFQRIFRFTYILSYCFLSVFIFMYPFCLLALWLCSLFLFVITFLHLFYFYLFFFLFFFCFFIVCFLFVLSTSFKVKACPQSVFQDFNKV